MSADGESVKGSQFRFQNNWFDLIRTEWEDRTKTLKDKPISILEIGCFEGACTTWMLRNLVNHPEAHITAVDTFMGGMEHQANDESGVDYGLGGLEGRFRSNVSRCEHSSKLDVMKMTSHRALLELNGADRKFDFIYIDASHVAIDVLQDAVMSWPLLRPQGILVFDDYSWKGYMEDCYNPRIAIEAFVKCAQPEIEAEETESQLWIRKVTNKITPTPNPDPALYYWDRGLARRPTG